MSLKIAIHQANFAPWLPYFYKMAMADKFIILKYTQFKKGGFENRYTLSNGTIVTKPVKRGLEPLKDKQYDDGESLFETNMCWINAIKRTLGIKTSIVFEHETGLTGTERLIELIKFHGGNVYVTNPEAKDKYLDEALMMASGIDIEYCKVPRHLKIHTFEAFEKWGIEGTKNQLPRVKEHSALSHIR